MEEKWRSKQSDSEQTFPRVSVFFLSGREEHSCIACGSAWRDPECDGTGNEKTVADLHEGMEALLAM